MCCQVQEAVSLAQQAGVTVRMVTGDNLNTACAIAKQCGILTSNGVALEGPVFRTMTPAQVDAVLPRLQVLARSSPDDKYLLVTRLNGYAIPSSQMEWDLKHRDKAGVSWATHRDKLLPGYREEWEVRTTSMLPINDVFTPWFSLQGNTSPWWPCGGRNWRRNE